MRVRERSRVGGARAYGTCLEYMAGHRPESREKRQEA